MICEVCSEAADSGKQELHAACAGYTRCDCQHKPSKKYIKTIEELKTRLLEVDDPYAQRGAIPGNTGSESPG